MKNEMTKRAIEARLRENGLKYGEVALQNGASILVVERGGRIFGPFFDEERAGLYWINPVLDDPPAMAKFLAAGDWNLGGERVWIAPEVQYLVTDRRDFWGSLRFPTQMDPGAWFLDQPASGAWRLRQNLTLSAYNLASGQKDLHMERLIRPVADPLTNTLAHRTLLDGVVYAGYEQVVTLAEGKRDDIMSQAWILIQLSPGGQLVVPGSAAVEITDYNEPIDDAHCTRFAHWVTFRITGERRYKVGLRAAHTFGRLAYFNHLADGRAYLIVRNFFNNPSSPYVEEPAHLPGSRGESIHIYNDGGMFGGFGELECQGQTIGGVTGISSSTDQQMMWSYVGPAAKVAAIGYHLLGVAF